MNGVSQRRVPHMPTVPALLEHWGERWRQRGRATCVHGQCEGCLTWHDLGDQQQQGARTLSGGDFAGTGGLYDVWKEVVRG